MSLNISYYDEEDVVISAQGRLFYEVKPFAEIIKIVKDITRINIDKLVCVILQRRISKLKNIIEEAKFHDIIEKGDTLCLNTWEIDYQMLSKILEV